MWGICFRRVKGSLLALVAALLCGNMSMLWAAQTDVPQLTAGDLKKTYSLDGIWQFRPGDDMSWVSPGFDDSKWGQKQLVERWDAGGYPASNQIAWYRLTLKIQGYSPENQSSLPPQGVQIGKIMSAYQLYAGGKLIGSQGGFPPLSEINHDRAQVYPLPWSAVDEDGTLVLALRVWGGSELGVTQWSAGPYTGDFGVGGYAALLKKSFRNETPLLTMSVLFLGFGVYHIYLYLRNRQLDTYLWYGLMALDIGIYGTMLSQWRYRLEWSFLAYEKIELGVIYLFPALVIQMTWALIDLPIGRGLRAYQLSFVGFALVVVLVPGFDIHYYTLRPWQIWSIALLVAVPCVTIEHARKGNSEARTVLVGVLVFVAACVNDLMIDFAGWEASRLVPLGFVAVMLCMAVSVANRFTAMLNNLEGEVAQRTSQLLSANTKLAEAATRDPLTELLNRRGFSEHGEAEIERFLRTGREFSIILGDLDDFKAVNDKYGHACGDSLLIDLAKLLREGVREMDNISRWGGEEFIFILPETYSDGAAQLAEKLRASLQVKDFEYRGQHINVTMTFGVASFLRGETLENCIARADTALYQGKERGRNRVMLGSYKGLSLIS
ncbi:MAG: diguanylate cyclase (GGDEF)-like protein [Halioglobus sp.]|jgi:diguanylate cyclase (GGDEF)-like protein